MKSNKKIKIPLYLDQKLRMSFRSIFVSRLVRKSGFSGPSHLFQRGIAITCIFLLIIGVRFFDNSSARYVQAAVNFAYTEAQLQSELIKHQEVVYSEGDDKVSFAQNLENFDTTQAVSRSESVERWQHGNNSLVIINPALAGVLPSAHLNFESDNHVHVFQYQFKDEATQVLTREEEKTRALLDSVHDLDSLYEDALRFMPVREDTLLDWVQNMEYIGVEKDNGKKSIFSVKHTDTLHSILTFDADSGVLLKRSVFVVTTEREYEMAIVEYGDIEWINSTKAVEIFDPKAYSFEQIDLVPIK